MDLPLSYSIKTIGKSKNTLYLFKNKEYDKSAPPHFHVAIPISDDDYVLLVIFSSKVDKILDLRSRQGLSESIVNVSKSDFKFLSKDSIVDCNECIFKTREELELIIDGNIELKEIEEGLDKLINEVKTALKKSTRIKPFIQNKIIS